MLNFAGYTDNILISYQYIKPLDNDIQDSEFKHGYNEFLKKNGEGKNDDSKIDEAKIEQEIIDEGKIDEGKIEQEIIDESKIDDGKIEQEKIDESKIDEGKNDESKNNETTRNIELKKDDISDNKIDIEEEVIENINNQKENNNIEYAPLSPAYGNNNLMYGGKTDTSDEIMLIDLDNIDDNKLTENINLEKLENNEFNNSIDTEEISSDNIVINDLDNVDQSDTIKLEITDLDDLNNNVISESGNQNTNDYNNVNTSGLDYNSGCLEIINLDDNAETLQLVDLDNQNINTEADYKNKQTGGMYEKNQTFNNSGLGDNSSYSSNKNIDIDVDDYNFDSIDLNKISKDDKIKVIKLE